MGGRAAWVLGIVGLVLAAGALPAGAAGGHTARAHRRRKPHEFDIIYRGSGEFGYDSAVTPSNGCTKTTTGDGTFAFEQEWDVLAKVSGDSAKITKIDYVGGPNPTGPELGENQAHFTGGTSSSTCNVPFYLGSFDCTGSNLIPTSIEGVDLIFAKKGKRFIVLPEGIAGYKGALTGSDTIDADGHSCDAYKPALPTPNSAFTPITDSWGKIPVKEATLANLKKGHHFQVSISLGHYTTGSLSQYNARGCLGIEDHNPSDHCTVTTDDFSGTFSVHRVR